MARAFYSERTGADDLILCPQSVSGIVNNLEKRFKSDVIYTTVGPVLVSVNPYTFGGGIKDLYTEQMIEEYIEARPHESPPHIYNLASGAYHKLMDTGENVVIVVSGESGSGKTEACRQVMKFVTFVTESSDDRIEFVKKVLVQSSDILEAFGNAKTRMNYNSSRFGKLMALNFSHGGQPISGHIVTYILEPRVVSPGYDERNFHIFYQMFAGLDSESLEALALTGGAKSFNYLACSGCFKVPEKNDSKDWKELQEALALVGFSDDEKWQMWELLAALLWMGNIEFVDDESGEGCELADYTPLENAAYLLHTDAKFLENALKFRTLTTAPSRGSVYSSPSTKDQAEFARDALVKQSYKRLFDYLVYKINESILVNPSEVFASIYTLDIAGFEIMFDEDGYQRNSLEQLMINTVNEKLQQYFISVTLREEQEEMEREGIPWEPIKYFDNQKVIDLLEKKKGLSVYGLLDEECIKPKGSDHGFVVSLSNNLLREKSLVSASDGQFTIGHYADKVTYLAEGFIVKNQDRLEKDIVGLLCTMCESKLIKLLFPTDEYNADQKKRPPTMCKQFLKSVKQMMKDLYACHPLFCRCIRPNGNKRPGQWDKNLTTQQVTYLGLLENVKVRRAGYSLRAEYGQFLNRFRLLNDATWPKYNGSDREGVGIVLKGIGYVENENFRFGKTKIFVKQPEVVYGLEEARDRALGDRLKPLQRLYRKYHLRKTFLMLRMRSYEMFADRKQRRRLSVRRNYFGDYLGYADDIVVQAVMREHGDKRVTFSSDIIKPNQSLKEQARQLVLGEKNMYVFKGLGPKKKIRRIVPIPSMKQMSFSPYADGYFVIHCPSEDYDFISRCELKTELVTAINNVKSDKSQELLKLNFSSSITYRARKGKPKTLTFQQQAGVDDVAVKKQNSKTLGVSVGKMDLATESDYESVLEFKRLQSQPRKKAPPKTKGRFQHKGFSKNARARGPAIPQGLHARRATSTSSSRPPARRAAPRGNANDPLAGLKGVRKNPNMRGNSIGIGSTSQTRKNPRRGSPKRKQGGVTSGRTGRRTGRRGPRRASRRR